MSNRPHQNGALILHSIGCGPASIWIVRVPLRPDREGVEENASCMSTLRSRLAPGCACPSRQEDETSAEQIERGDPLA